MQAALGAAQQTLCTRVRFPGPPSRGARLCPAQQDPRGQLGSGHEARPLGALSTLREEVGGLAQWPHARVSALGQQGAVSGSAPRSGAGPTGLDGQTPHNPPYAHPSKGEGPSVDRVSLWLPRVENTF